MNSKLFAVLAGVVALALMCFAQEAADSPSQPQPYDAAKIEATMRENFYQMQRADEARRAGQGNGAADTQPPKNTYRIQLMLLCIPENADESKLTDIRAAAQSSDKRKDLFEIADQLVANEAGVVVINPILTASDGRTVNARFKAEGSSSFTEKLSGKSIEHTMLVWNGYDIDATTNDEPNGRVAVHLNFKYSYGPQVTLDRVLPSERIECEWSGNWSGPRDSQAMLLADTPRRPGAVPAFKRSPERYLLMRIAPVE